ncbi:efflux RND transporter periplasmic adaptor subunit [Pseudomonas sp. FEN]|uniref:efflux RND transporter periplasmic adaptor subunit n=1 Tax=Pseudomonas sp. FEN TaxID=2767468 RepID=UPI0017481728|nr:efflux RND transporter periplasmic adaptor subunit [Pseudomonas sp. FEN]CAD5204056.1 RND efflux system, membrane fusion protein [Pseudomonas sp. FEN]
MFNTSLTTCHRVLLSLAALLLLNGCSAGDPPAPTARTQEVGVYVVTAKSQALTLSLPGRTSAHMTAEIRPQVGGIIQKRLFKEGDDVKSGQALYQIDPRSYQASVTQAEANVSSAKATLEAARLKAKRDAQLVKIDAVSTEDNESAQASLLEAQASLQSYQAALQTARINLGYTRITAPISGRVDTSSVTPGALVTAEQDTALTTVRQLDPIYVDVTQPSSTVLRLKRELAQGQLAASTQQNATNVQVLLEDGSSYAHTGTLTFNGVSVDEGTGSITLRAIVPNPQGLLLPGMYVKAVIDEGTKQDAILVPQQGVIRDERGDASAWVVVDNKVEQRQLKIHSAVDSRWWVSSGLKVGDQLIIEGVQKVRNGDTVKVVEVGRDAQKADSKNTNQPSQQNTAVASRAVTF